MIDMTNKKFGHLTVLHKTERKNKARSFFWMCLCDCGVSKEIDGQSIRSGLVVSCGCYGKKKRRESNTTHNLSKSGTYRSWDSMIQRCTNKNKNRHEDYGGRGISVCESWLDFKNFLSDMGERPDGNFSIERIDNDKGYYKENCKWADGFEQASNKRISSKNSSGFTGVSFHARRKKYIAYIERNGKRKHLGYFSSLEDAVKARAEALLIAEWLRRQNS